GLIQRVGNLNDGLLQDASRRGDGAVRTRGESCARRLQCLLRVAVVGYEVHQLAVEPVHRGDVRTAKTPRALRDRVEDRHDIRRRATDDLEDLRGRRLLLQRLRQALL